MESQGQAALELYIVIKKRELFHLFPYSFADTEGLIPGHVKQYDKEFLTAPADHLMFAAASLQNIGNADKSHIGCCSSVKERRI